MINTRGIGTLLVVAAMAGGTVAIAQTQRPQTPESTPATKGAAKASNCTGFVPPSPPRVWNVMTVYPHGPASRDIEGDVQYSVRISKTGQPSEFRVVRSSLVDENRFGSDSAQLFRTSFESATRRLVLETNFIPARCEGEPVESIFESVLNFRLE